MRISFIIGLLFSFCRLSAQYSIPVNTEILITKDFQVLEDISGKLKLSDLESAQNKGLFKNVNDSSFKATTSIYWLKFTLTNDKNYNSEAVLDFQNWAYADAYINGPSESELHRTGHLVPYRKRDYPAGNKSYIKLKLKAGQKLNILVRLESRKNNDLIPQNLNFKIADKKHIDSVVDFVGKGIYAFFAIFIISFLYNLFIYFSTRLKFYLYYLLVLLMALYQTAYFSGYMVEVFQKFDSFPLFLTHLPLVFASQLLGLSVILFVRNFLKINERYPFWNKLLNWLLIFYAVVCIIFLIDDQLGTKLSGLSGIITFIIIVTVIIKSVKDRYPSAWFFLLGYSSFLIAVLLIIAMVLGIMPYNAVLFEFGLPVGSTTEIVVFSFALANMINVLRKENDTKQLEIIKQLEEKEQLQTKVTRELEAKVAERTSLIQHQQKIIEAEKEKSDELLLNILPESTANELKNKGYSSPKNYPDVAVLFTDFVDFTRISTHLSAEELVAQLDYCFQAFDQIIVKYKLEKIKTIGDAYMAVAGAPDILENNVEKTILAAKEIVEFVRQWNEDKQKNGADAWEIRVGIHNGPVVGGVVGKNKYSFDIWGDTVNMASRMESSGKPGKINISGMVFQRIHEKFECEYRGKLPVKGGPEMDMYFVNA